MTNDMKFPTQAELRAYEMAARELRAQTMSAGIKTIFRLPKAALEGLRAWAARPTHA